MNNLARITTASSTLGLRCSWLGASNTPYLRRSKRMEIWNMIKYRDMLLESAETVLSIFGFNRTVYVDAPKKYKKWWQPLREERTRDRDTETI